MFATLPDDSKLWVFCFVEPASDAQTAQLSAALSRFVSEWRAHGAPVSGAFNLIEGHFLLMASDCRGADVSGCSIDSMFQAVLAAAAAVGLTIADPSTIFFRGTGGKVSVLSRSEFKALAKGADFDRRTSVFDPVLTSLRELRAKGFELPFENAWHARAFG